jgi:4-diphosphocytidyl-2-C-methyl-D-erythritol kinase
VTLCARAPGKINLCLFLGPVRADGRHELVTVFESVSLADELRVAITDGDSDEVVCAGVAGPNLVSDVLSQLRARGWDAPPVRITISKQVPVAAGMGGGSGDAAAALRLAVALSPGLPERVVAELARGLGSDVPGQLRPGLSLGTSAGEIVEPLAALAPHAFVVVPQPFGLSTADVYREADRLGLPRGSDGLASRLAAVRATARPGAELSPESMVNDLGAAALSLRPEIASGLDAVRETGADHAMISGSGPTVLGLFWGARAEPRAGAAAAGLADRYPGASSAVPVSEEFGMPR